MILKPIPGGGGGGGGIPSFFKKKLNINQEEISCLSFYCFNFLKIK